MDVVKGVADAVHNVGKAVYGSPYRCYLNHEHNSADEVEKCNKIEQERKRMEHELEMEKIRAEKERNKSGVCVVL